AERIRSFTAITYLVDWIVGIFLSYHDSLKALKPYCTPLPHVYIPRGSPRKYIRPAQIIQLLIAYPLLINAHCSLITDTAPIIAPILGMPHPQSIPYTGRRNAGRAPKSAHSVQIQDRPEAGYLSRLTLQRKGDFHVRNLQ